MLDIVCCVKVVTDPEAPVSTFKIDAGARRVLPAPGVPPVLNPYDENALEAAVRIKEQQPAKITIVSLGKSVPKAVVRKCLAVGADDLICLEDDAFEEIDAAATAAALAAAIGKLEGYDLILAGRMAADTNAGLVGPGIAERLGLPAVTCARKVEVGDGTARIERALADGYEVVTAGLPCLVTVSHELGELRAANVKGLMAARKQPVTVWSAADLSLDTAALKPQRPLKLSVPERTVDCDMIAGETPEEVGAGLAQRLRDTGLL